MTLYKYNEYYENGAIFRERYIDDKSLFNGSFKEWYKNGVLSKECFYLNGFPDGEVKTWYPNGNLHTFFNSKNNKNNGFHVYISVDGVDFVESWYKEGLLHGSYREYKNNKLCLTCHFYNGFSIGLLKACTLYNSEEIICTYAGLKGTYLFRSYKNIIFLLKFKDILRKRYIDRICCINNRENILIPDVFRLICSYVI